MKKKFYYVTNATTAKRKTAPRIVGVLGLCLLISSCATVLANPPVVTYTVDIGFPPAAVPAGVFKVFRLQSSVALGNAFSTLWYAPELNLIVKRVDERTAHHPLGPEKRVTEMVEYHKPTKTSHRSSADGIWH